MSDYRLKNGASLSNISSIFPKSKEKTYNNQNLTNEIAEIYLRYYPEKIGLFSDFPRDWEERCMKECFFITPIGEDDSEERAEYNQMFEFLNSILNDYKITFISSEKIYTSGNITNQIIEKLLLSDLVIANVANLNPNVMYELGIRHAVEKQVICIAKKETKLPFNLKDYRTLFYDSDNIDAFAENLKKSINDILSGSQVQNPVTTTKKQLTNQT